MKESLQNEHYVLNYLIKHKEFIGPTDIAFYVFGPDFNSSKTSPICKRLVKKGLAVRNEKGWYKAAEGVAKPLIDEPRNYCISLDTCPFCGAYNAYGESDTKNDGAFQSRHMECDECGHEWEQIELVTIDIVGVRIRDKDYILEKFKGCFYD